MQIPELHDLPDGTFMQTKGPVPTQLRLLQTNECLVQHKI